MERLTKRIFVPKEERELGELVVFTQGEYIDTIPAEMTHEDIRKVLRKLAEYEDLEERGLLLRLPCKVGDTVYSIANDGKIYPVKATREVRIVNGVLHIICESCRYSDLVSYDDIGKTVFFTQAEAEQKLKEMERD